MVVINTSKSKVISDKNGILIRQLFSNNSIEFVRMTVQPNSSVEKKSLPFEVQYFVLEGEGIFHFGNESFNVEKDSLVKCIKYVDRYWQNIKEVPLEILIVKNLVTKK